MPGIDLRLLATDTANALIGAVNALLNRKVAINGDDARPSSHDVAEHNSLLTITRRDLVQSLGNTLGAHDVNSPCTTPDCIDLTATGTTVRQPGGASKPASPAVNHGGNWSPDPTISVNENGNWFPAGCTAPLSIQYRSRTGTATLCGFSEYTAPSVPPKKYLTQTASGDYFKCQSDLSGSKRELTGSYTFDPTTCGQANTQNLEQWLGPNPGDCHTGPFFSNAVMPMLFTAVDLDVPNATVTTSATSVKWDGNGFVGSSGTETGELKRVLSDEDTDENAIDRAVPPGDYTTPGSQVAFRTVRGAGQFSFSFVEVDWRIELRGLQPGETYNLLVTYGRRVDGSGDPFVEFATDTFSNVAAGGDEFTDWQAMPSEDGFDTNILSIAVCLTS